MKIVFILPGCGMSGGVKSTAVIANKLIDRGHDVRILYLKVPVTIRGLFKFIWLKSAYKNNSDGLKKFKGRIDTFNDILTCSFDEKEVIVGVGMWASSQLALLKSISNPKLQYIHGMTPWDTELMEKALRLPIPKVVVSFFLKPFVESFEGGKVLGVVPNWIDQQEYFSSVNETQRNGIGMIYSSHPVKDPQTILAVLEKLSKNRFNVPRRIFGADRRHRQIPKNSYLRLPSVEKAREIYSRSLVWIVASRSEGFSLPVLEAMACGCVVVATKCGGPEDIIEHGVDGFLVDVGNVEQICKYVELLINNESLRRTICSNAADKVRKFTWEKSIDKLEEILISLFKMGK